jgi:23S rRNA A2030 N6-methylase RlmJ
MSRIVKGTWAAAAVVFTTLAAVDYFKNNDKAFAQIETDAGAGFGTAALVYHVARKRKDLKNAPMPQPK